MVVFSWYASTAQSGEVYIYCIWANVKLENSLYNAAPDSGFARVTELVTGWVA